MKRSLAAGLLCVIALAGCGGSSSGSDHSKLLSQLQTRLQQSDSSLNAPDLVSCIVNQAKSLPTDQLKTAANAPANGSDNSPAAQKLAYKLAAPCVAEGHGAPGLRAAVLSSIQSSSLSSLPPAYAACVTAKAKGITNAQLAAFLKAGEQSQAAIHAAGEQLGRQYGNQCLGDSSVLSAMRALFVRPIRSEVAKYSPAFGRCVLAQAEALPDSTLRGLISHPATAEAQAQTLGKDWAQRCVARGIRP